MKTQIEYQREIRTFRAAVGKPLAQVTQADAEEFASRLESLTLAPASRRRALSAVKSLFSFAVRFGHIERNPFRFIHLPPGKDELANRILDADDVEQLVAAPPLPRDRAMLEVLYGAGLRVSEMCGLTWADVRAREDGGQVTVHGKRSKTRTIKIQADTLAMILALRRENDTAGDPVFRSREGGKLSRQQAWRIVKAAAIAAKIDPRTSPHYLRHCFCSHALQGGAPSNLVQRDMGHAKLATTERYSHVRPADGASTFLRRHRIVHSRGTKPRGATIGKPAGFRSVGGGAARKSALTPSRR